MNARALSWVAAVVFLAAIPKMLVAEIATKRFVLKVHGSEQADTKPPEETDDPCVPHSPRFFRMLPDGTVAVEGVHPGYITVFSREPAADGREIAKIGSSSNWIFSSIGDFVVLPDGSFLFIQEAEQALVRVDRAGKVLSYWQPPLDLPVQAMSVIERAPDGRILVGDTGLNQLLVLSPTLEHEKTLAWESNGLTVTSDGSIVLLESKGDVYRIVSYDQSYRPKVFATLAHADGEFAFVESVTADNTLLVSVVDSTTQKTILRQIPPVGPASFVSNMPQIDSLRPVRPADGHKFLILMQGKRAAAVRGFVILEVSAAREPTSRVPPDQRR